MLPSMYNRVYKALSLSTILRLTYLTGSLRGTDLYMKRSTGTRV